MNEGSEGDNTVALPGYQVGPEECGIEHSASKLQAAEDALMPHIPSSLRIESQPAERPEDTLTYRCRCTFQLVRADSDETWKYAMRYRGSPICLGTDAFPVATLRIQSAMRGLMDHVLNTESDSFHQLKRGLTSITFSSAWNDDLDADCIVTMHYDQPIDEVNWKKESFLACQTLGLRQLNGRSKGKLLFALESNEATIRDVVYIDKEDWTVSLARPTAATDPIQVMYEKPETAFYHPNAHAMRSALQWMLKRLSLIASESAGAPRHLLEMYCGCGAHTVALAKTGLLSGIVAVELDHRLAEACNHNVIINELQAVVRVDQADAGIWSKRSFSKLSQSYDILLVDPPRAGLDEMVCRMAKEGAFQHFLYISCGHKALLRDLERLSDTFEVVHCCQLDLFPRTDSIETLVHLRRSVRKN